jgi:uncharacterized membrane protein YhaH (DUF805 family)
MILPFRFEGRIGRLPYAAWSAGAFFSQHVAIGIGTGRVPKLDWTFLLVPLRTLVSLDGTPSAVMIPAFIWFLLVAWALAALAFRRAADAGEFEGIAVLATTPVVQIPLIVFLCALRPSPIAARASREDAVVTGPTWHAIAQGVVAGVGLTVAAVIVGALIFGVYGFTVFIVSPCVIGAVTAYLANRAGDLGKLRTNILVVSTALLGGIALMVTALEGAVCILLASPLALGAVLIGGTLGRSAALSSRRSAKHTLSGLAVMPLVFAAEAALPPIATFDTLQTIDVAAPPSVVWNAIVHMSPLDEPVAFPFRLGVAYPIRGEIIGEGVGAIRRGYFSTGVALERITEWLPDRKLTFVVESDPPAMAELSPYAKVYAPHVLGYFHTRSTSFELLPGRDGHTTLVERSGHELKLDPVLYWLPMTEWAVGENNARALAHIKNDAEDAFRKGRLTDQH